MAITLDSGDVLTANATVSGTDPLTVSFTRTVTSANLCGTPGPSATPPATPRVFVYNYSFSFGLAGTGSATATWSYGLNTASCVQCATAAGATPAATPVISDSATLTKR